jgi:hypothetical protein
MGGRVLFVVLSGPSEVEKARQALRIARNMAKEKFVDDVRMLFVGPGTTLLDPSNPHYSLVENYLKALNELEVYVAVCAGNARAYNLDEKIDKQLVVMDDSTAVLAEAVAKGYVIVTF